MIDRELLWRAYPEGYLARRGVSTVGGWQCVAELRDVERRMDYAFWLKDDLVSLYGLSELPAFSPVGYGAASPLNMTPITTALKAGDLLPNVDPADVATWACLKADLVRAAKLNDEGELTFSGRDGMWALSTINRYSGGRTITFVIDTDDPTLALVRARIQLQEAT